MSDQSLNDFVYISIFPKKGNNITVNNHAKSYYIRIFSFDVMSKKPNLDG